LVTHAGIWTFKIVVVLIVVLSVLPLLTGGIDVEFGSDSESDWTFNDTTISSEFPITVSNNGFWSINDLTVSFTFRDREGHILTESLGEPVDIPAGGDTEVPIGLSFDLNDLGRQERADFIFNGTAFNMDIALSARYALDLVRLNVDGSSEMEWGALISDLDVRTEEARPYFDGSNYSMVIPYTFHSHEMLQGGSILVLTEFRDSYGYVGNVSQLVTMEPGFWREACVPITYEVYERIVTTGDDVTASVTLFFLDCSQTMTEEWYAYGGWMP